MLSVSLPRLSLRGRRATNRRVFDPQLIQIGLVLRRIEVELAHLGPIAVHDGLVQVNRRLILRPDERRVFPILGLHLVEVFARLREDIRAHQQIDDRHRLNAGASDRSLVSNRGRHRDRVGPVVARSGLEVGREAQGHRRQRP